MIVVEDEVVPVELKWLECCGLLVAVVLCSMCIVGHVSMMPGSGFLLAGVSSDGVVVGVDTMWGTHGGQ